MNEFQGQFDSPVATHNDEVYMAKPWMVARPLYDIGRVEVLKGPQGTLFGRNTTGGSVNYYTNKPTDKFGANLEIGFDEHERYMKEFGMEKIWYMQWGNHEYKSRVVTEGDMKRYCKTKHITFLGSKAFARLDIQFKGTSLMKKTLFVNHGAGGGGTLKALENLTINCEADIYQMGHLHDPMGVKRDTFFYNDKKNKWDTKEQILVNSGCFTTAVSNNVDQWMEQKGNKLMTSKPGTWTISFDAYNNKVSQHG